MATAKKPTVNKAAKGKSSRAKSQSGDRSAEDRLIDATMKLVVDRGWRNLSLAEIGEAAGLGLAELHAIAPSKSAILNLLIRRIDRQVLAEGRLSEDQGSARDRLFDVLMRRFDAMQPYRVALGEILYDCRRDPLSLATSLPRLACSMAWMLEAAGLDSHGLRGVIRIKGLSAAYLVTLRTWLKDDSNDLAATMATLDRQLLRLDGWARRCRGPQRQGETQAVGT
ncbi:TetR family transcriptional regulator [Limibacillus sp. MBR-115]|jgi:AcrR family transcriptional regulator|uniref:TetR family transcriptional regulator n=1 Tax=Limibacillus sp. MBR-115 TaxID=3156465 RepID=UPI0033935631